VNSNASEVRPLLKQIGIRNVSFGINVVVVEPCNLYDCALGDDCFVGPFVEIQRGVKIGARCKIQSHAFLCELVSVGDDCVVAHGVMFINDLYRSGSPARGDRRLWKETIIGNRVLIGSNSTILPVRICDGVTIGAGSVVTKDITSPGIYAGNPARRLRGFESATARPSEPQIPACDNLNKR
jgi:acetyltransferase-like isoleucine patch superfamily enzyme